jgi:hypothetical protein
MSSLDISHNSVERTNPREGGKRNENRSANGKVGVKERDNEAKILTTRSLRVIQRHLEAASGTNHWKFGPCRMMYVALPHPIPSEE